MSGREKNWRTHHIDVRLGARLAQLRGERGLTRADLARKLGVSDAALQHVEEGQTRLTASQLWQICGVTGIDVTDVFARMPNHVFKKRTEYEALGDATASTPDFEASPAGPRPARQPGVREPGVLEDAWRSHGAGGERDDLVALAKAARRLTHEQVSLLIAAAKGWAR